MTQIKIKDWRKQTFDDFYTGRQACSHIFHFGGAQSTNHKILLNLIFNLIIFVLCMFWSTLYCLFFLYIPFFFTFFFSLLSCYFFFSFFSKWLISCFPFDLLAHMTQTVDSAVKPESINQSIIMMELEFWSLIFVINFL